jgi:hypothetical protein
MADRMSPVEVKDNSTSIQNPQNNFRSGGADPKTSIANSPQKNPIKPGQ